MSKTCPNCLILKEIHDFWKVKRNSDGLSSQCKKCSPRKKYANDIISKNKWRALNPTYSTNWARNNIEKVKRSSLKSRLKVLYNMTLDDYNDLLKNQNYKCKICKVSEPVNKRFCVDHCHKTGIIRGLLCDRCNKVIGQFEDDISLFEESINYIISSKTIHVVNFQNIMNR